MIRITTIAALIATITNSIFPILTLISFPTMLITIGQSITTFVITTTSAYSYFFQYYCYYDFQSYVYDNSCYELYVYILGSIDAMSSVSTISVRL